MRTSGIDDVFYGCQWHLDNDSQFAESAGNDINVEPVWTAGNLGADINVAIVDDGIDHRHPDLADNVALAKNHDYNGNNDIYNFLFRHGTSVAGIVASRDNSLGTRGVAPRANIYGYDLLAAETEGAAAGQRNEADAMSRGAASTAVSNNSWGPADSALHEPSHSFWRTAIETGIKTGYGGKGTFYAWAGGNGGRIGDYSNLDEYANHSGVTGVCAVDHTDRRAPYSEPGSNLWVCAPSNGDAKSPGIATTTNQGLHVDDFSGTSAATPQVSGAWLPCCARPTAASPGGT